MRHLRKVVLGSAALVVASGVGFIMFARPGPATPALEDPRQAPPLVRTAEVRPATASERAFTGVISARVQSNLGFRVNGKIVERLVDVGERVVAGQTLMRIDPKDLELARTARDNAVAAAQAQVVQAEADETRYSRLVADGWTPRQRYEQARAALDTARAQLEAARAEAEVARNETGYAELRADADGTVVETLGEPGQVSAAGQVVIRLAHAGAREATVNLPETARPLVGSGAEARVYGVGTGRSHAQLRQLSDSADPTTRTYEARYVLDGEAAQAPLGATVTVWLARTDAAGNAETEIPLGAILDDGRASGVWVIGSDTSTVTRRPVAIRRLGQETAVVTGLNPGETIVALGAHLLHEGDRVRAAETRTAAQ
ncbi:efflux RND transporter periplasmic adaptor subunit [Ancylobacter sp. Lp-2]|uniref:efflux RND transporter periplasmic adaptor subunit n=1 Tax=Ancylobacter sp. Lp-2 TaxID=2881339 RepID=UPI001E408C03|nr:efflux RND transporter periplasmic adaptor subunit [Ancylobacter sp. Lp-2]MCB4767862.1 efflux RND transporter periplasmic adaptor subunit [Ancylobacter sp. Lp-2]